MSGQIMGGVARRAMTALALVAIAGTATACRADVTSDRVRTTFDRAFARLYALQQADLGRGGVRPGHFFAEASCQKGATGSQQTGAGDDWVCVEQWQLVTGSVTQATYELSVSTDGCLDAVGPAGVVGPPILTGASGQAIVNPLTQFDACFSA